MRRQLPHRRRGFVLIILLVTSFMVVTFGAVMGRLVVIEFKRERLEALAAHADQMLHSARTWSLAHPDKLYSDRSATLPVDVLVPEPYRAGLNLQRTSGAGGAELIQCDVRLERWGVRVQRTATWPTASTGDALKRKIVD